MSALLQTPTGLRDLGLLKVGLTSNGWGKEGIEFLGLFCVPGEGLLATQIDWAMVAALVNRAAKGDPLVPPKWPWKTYQRKCPERRGLKGSLLSAPPILHAPGLGIRNCHYLWSQGRFVITHHLSSRALWGDAENASLVKDGFYSYPFL